jgi:hypothetical protein
MWESHNTSSALEGNTIAVLVNQFLCGEICIIHMVLILTSCFSFIYCLLFLSSKLERGTKKYYIFPPKIE